MPAFSFEKLPPPEFRESMPASPVRFRSRSESATADTAASEDPSRAESPEPSQGSPRSHLLDSAAKPYRGLVVQMLDRLTRSPR